MTKTFLLYTSNFPNGKRVSIFLEELKALYPGLDYDVESLHLQSGDHKQPWFRKFSPGGLIPALVDRSQNELPIFESAAILLYLLQHYDKDNKLGWDPVTHPSEHSQMLQWICFVHAEVATREREALYYLKFATEQVPFANNRNMNETKRLYGVLNDALTDRDFFVGPDRGSYSVADINLIPWVQASQKIGIESVDEWPNLKRWYERVSSRDEVKKGLAVPESSDSWHRSGY